MPTALVGGIVGGSIGDVLLISVLVGRQGNLIDFLKASPVSSILTNA